MKLTDEWFTSLSHTEGGQLVFVTVRKELEQFIASGSLRVRVAISWPYAAEADGMPDEATAQLIEEIEPLLRRTMDRRGVRRWLSMERRGSSSERAAGERRTRS